MPRPTEERSRTRRARSRHPRRRRGRTARAATGPVRTCIGCRRATGAQDLVRIRLHASEVGTSLELGAGPGRGAWLCRSDPVVCLDEALRRRALERALRTTIRTDDIQRIRARLADGVVPVKQRSGRSV